MATFPNVKFDWRDLAETPESVVERSEMERGIPKQRRFASDARVEIPLTLHFDTKAEAEAWLDWFYDDINAGQDFFDYTHPRTGTVVQGRIVDGDPGTLKFQQQTLDACSRMIKIEYWRSAW